MAGGARQDRRFQFGRFRLAQVFRDDGGALLTAAGLVILAFPCNDFGGQEPGTIEEIQAFCKANYAVTFPIMGKLSVKGEGQHELYKALTGPGGAFPGDVKWNFGKILIDKNGKPIARFESMTAPDSEELKKAVEAALAG